MAKIKSKPYGKVYIHDENPDRRVTSPEWMFYPSFLEQLDENAKKLNMSRSCFFERVISNFFILDDPKIFIQRKRNYSISEKKVVTPRIKLHPTIIEMIQESAKAIKVSQSQYIWNLFLLYKHRYNNELDLKNILV